MTDLNDQTPKPSLRKGGFKKIDSSTRNHRKPSTWEDPRVDLDSKIEARIKSVPIKHRGLFIKAVKKQVSSKRAIRAFCQSCMGYEDLPTSVRECTALTCPLWTFRPYQEKPKC